MDLKSKFKDGLSKSTVKKIAIAVVVVAVVVVIYKSKVIQNKFFASKTVTKQNTTNVKKGNLKVLVSGSGPIYFTNTSKIYSKIGATVTKVNYKEGDKVKAGDIIYEMDDTDAQTSVNSNLNTFKQNQISASASAEDVSNLSIRAPFTGLVSDIIVNQGDTVQKGGTVFTISDTTKLKVLLTYNMADIVQVALGQSAKVNISSLMQSIDGTVTYISNQPTASSVGAQLYTVEIQINNPGAILAGMTASADIQTPNGAVSSTGTAALNYINKQLVTSLTGGTVQNILVKQNQKVNSGQVLITMKNDDITRAKQNSDLQVENAQNQMTLNTKQLDNYKIIAPIDGVITLISNKVGDTIKAGDELSSISDPTQMEFDVPVDELDIAKIQVGQKTNITVDALPDTTKTPVTGEVSKVAVTGTSVSGVTAFTVTVKVDDSLDKLKGGMNANAEIEVTNKDNILYVPINAITTTNGKSYVMLKKAGAGGQGGVPTMGQRNSATTATSKGNSKSEATVSTKIVADKSSSNFSGGMPTGKMSAAASKKQSYYDGSVLTEVQVGSNNDTNIEITSGLKEGDVVVLPETQAASTAKSTSTRSNSNMGGGPPGGGF